MAPGDPPARSRQAPDPFARVLARVDQTDARVGDLVRTVTGLADDVAGVARSVAKVTGGAGGADDGEVLPAWLLVEDPTEATGRIGDLIGWLDAVYLRYERTELPSCWLWHPGAVEELLVLREVWREAYEGPRRSWKAVSEWHDRALPGVLARLAPLQSCALSLHAKDGSKDHAAPTAPLRSAVALLPAMWAVSRDLPLPTPEELAQARQHANLPTQTTPTF